MKIISLFILMFVSINVYAEEDPFDSVFLEKMVRISAKSPEVEKDSVFAKKLHMLMLYVASKKFYTIENETGVAYWLMRTDMEPPTCMIDQSEYSIKKIGFSIKNQKHSNKKSTCAEIFLFREAVKNAITDEVREYRKFEMDYFESYVKDH